MGSASSSGANIADRVSINSSNAIVFISIKNAHENRKIGKTGNESTIDQITLGIVEAFLVDESVKSSN